MHICAKLEWNYRELLPKMIIFNAFWYFTAEGVVLDLQSCTFFFNFDFFNVSNAKLFLIFIRNCRTMKSCYNSWYFSEIRRMSYQFHDTLLKSAWQAFRSVFISEIVVSTFKLYRIDKIEHIIINICLHLARFIQLCRLFYVRV